MALYGNFEGTMKTTILLGKNGIKLNVNPGTLTINDSSNNLARLKINDAVDLSDAVSYQQLLNVSSILGSAATKDVLFFASAEQGSKADTALQQGNNISLLVNDSNYLIKSVSDTYYSTIDHGHALLTTALQPQDNISNLVNDSNYLIKSVSDTYYSTIGHSHSLIDTATSANTINTLVKRDSSGNISAGVITGTLIGNASSATKLASTRTITIQGDINASIPFDGSSDLTISSVFANSGVTAGTYNNLNTAITPIIVDAKGRITGTGAPVTITPAWESITAKPNTLSGYGISDAITASSIGAANGVASLDSSGKLSAAQIPTALVGAVNYQGVWDAQTNTPTLSSSVGTKGFYYKVSVAGSTTIDGISSWSVNDVIIYNGTTWDWLDGSNGSDIVSVNGVTGAVVLTTDNISEGATNQYFTTARASSAAPVQSVQGRTGNVTITSTDVGLNLVDNTKQLPYSQTLQVLGDVSSAITDLNLGQISLTLSNSGVTAGTYNNSSTTITPFTVDAKGRITASGEPVAITPAWDLITSKPTTIDGYGITDAQSLHANLTTISGLSTISTGLVKLTNGVASLDTATYLSSNQTITVSGDATGSGSTDILLELVDSGVTAGTYNSSSAISQFNIDAKGRVISVSAPVTITPAWESITAKPNTLSGYGITDAQLVNAILTSISALSTSTTGYIQVTNGVASLSVPEGGTGGVSTVASGCVYENSQTITANYTVTAGMNALSAGPITIADGVAVTIPDGSAWAIV